MPTAPHWPFAVSTLGVVEESLELTVAMLQRHGVRAAELRSAGGAFVEPDMDRTSRSVVRQQLAAAGIDIVSVASRVKIATSADDDEVVVGALHAELRLAADLGARFVRVFPGGPVERGRPDRPPEPLEDPEQSDTRAVRRLLSTLDVAARLGVRPVIETHDSHPRGTDVARILSRLDREVPGHPVGAIWDVLHPWRVGEDLERTAEALLPYLLDGRGYVQIKDVARAADPTPVLQGAGTVPVPHMLQLLDRGGYDGPVSLEWERFWHPQVAPLEEAVVAAAHVLAAHSPA